MNDSDLSTALESGVHELVNVITHGFGLLLAIAGAGVLTSEVIETGDGWRIAACSIYAAMLVAVYAASTLSHSFSDPKLRHLFRMLDQGFIYLLIVGTFTPFSVAYLRGGWWLFLGLMWAVALCGFVLKLFFAHRIYGVEVWTYVGLGWMPIVTVFALIPLLPGAALWWMLFGGLCYSFGTIFLLVDNKPLHFHGIWHMCVIAGSAFHFFAILFFVARV